MHRYIVGSKKLEYGPFAGFPSSPALVLGDSHIPTFWLPLYSKARGGYNTAMKEQSLRTK